jgi:hypothetical protein
MSTLRNRGAEFSLLLLCYSLMNQQWITVAEAARILGTSKQAIRQRIYRNTIEHRKDSEGTVYVHITGNNKETNGESHGETVGEIGSVSRELVEELRDRVSSLENQLEHERRANAEHRRLLAAALERIPAIEAPRDTPPEPRGSPQTASEEPSGTQASQGYQEEERRSWWRRMFGG